jgi:hypothetical protein
VASIVAPAPPVVVTAKIASFKVTKVDDRYVTFKGRVSGMTKAGKASIAVYIRSNGKYRKYVYTVAVSKSGTFSLRRKMPKEGRAYAIVTAYGAKMRSKNFKIDD